MECIHTNCVVKIFKIQYRLCNDSYVNAFIMTTAVKIIDTELPAVHII